MPRAPRSAACVSGDADPTRTRRRRTPTVNFGDPGVALLRLGRVIESAEHLTRVGTARDEVGDDLGSVVRTYGKAVVAAGRGSMPLTGPLFVRPIPVFSGWTWLSRPGWRWPESPPPTNVSATPDAPLDDYQRLLGHAECRTRILPR